MDGLTYAQPTPIVAYDGDSANIAGLNNPDVLQFLSFTLSKLA